MPHYEESILHEENRSDLQENIFGHQVAQSLERKILEAEVRGSKPLLSTWWWDRIPPNQPYLKGAVPAATDPQFPGKGLI